MCRIPIVIPSYEPDERLIELLEELKRRDMAPVIVVDDGSGAAYASFFERAAELVGAHSGKGYVLAHQQNRGKGAALKTAFSYVLENDPDAIGVVTADSDGQHSPECIDRVGRMLMCKPDALVMGVRDFSGADVPWKSRMGNRITSWVFERVCGLAVSDTQTGLRGIPRDLMRRSLELSGDRFEFETQMLMLAGSDVPVAEVPIATIYDSRDNHQTHFNPWKDSLRIYRILLREPACFALSSVASFVVDISLFSLMCRLLGGLPGYVALSTAAARVVSASFNYFANSRVVFHSKQKDSVAGIRYLMLAGIQLTLSATLTTVGTAALPWLPEVAVKVVVDGVLFVLSFMIQKHFVF